MKLTIEQLADKVNEIIAGELKVSPESLTDGRQSNVVSVRRIRDYITKGLIEKPVGEGREKWFDDSHVNALVALRLLQRNGLSDKYVSSSIKNDSLVEQYTANILNNSLSDSNNLFNEENAENNPDKVMQDSAMSFLNSLQNKSSASQVFAKANGLLSGSGTSIATSILEQSLQNKIGNSYVAKEADSHLLYSLSQPKYQQFNEYCIDDKMGVFLKVDSKTDAVLQRKLVEVIKNEINNYNKENKK